VTPTGKLELEMYKNTFIHIFFIILFCAPMAQADDRKNTDDTKKPRTTRFSVAQVCVETDPNCVTVYKEGESFVVNRGGVDVATGSIRAPIPPPPPPRRSFRIRSVRSGIIIEFDGLPYGPYPVRRNEIVVSSDHEHFACAWRIAENLWLLVIDDKDYYLHDV
jgi:hypothetical protein